jgi:hypothetical protein
MRIAVLAAASARFLIAIISSRRIARTAPVVRLNEQNGDELHVGSNRMLKVDGRAEGTCLLTLTFVSLTVG